MSAARTSLENGHVTHALPLHWPAVLKMRDELQALAMRDDAQTENARTLASRSRRTSTQALTSDAPAVVHKDQDIDTKAPFFIMKPNSRIRSSIDLLSIAILFYDLTLIPVVLAWDLEYSGFIWVMAWVVVGFWTLEMCLNFISGYYNKGMPVMNPRKVTRHYLRTWFTIDLCVVSTDWLSLILQEVTTDEGGSSSLKILRFAKLSRLLRIIGMLRLLKFVRKFEEYVEGNLSETWRLALQFSRIFLVTLWCNHVLACGWWFVGRWGPTDTDYSWAQATIPAREDGLRYSEANQAFQYATAFHWSVAQITLGAVEVTCGSTMERMYNVVCLLLGLLFGTTLISSISATMVDYQMNRKEQTDKLRIMRRYLHENAVAPRLAIRVTQQILERLGERQRLHQGNVHALALLAPSLQLELRFHISRPHLNRHALFRLWTSLDQVGVQTHFMDVVDITSLRQQDELFIAGEEGNAAYLLVNGKLCYSQDPEVAPVTERVETMIGIDGHQWLAEAALWSHWIHVGTAEAVNRCEITMMKAEPLGQAVKKSSIIQDVTLQYCQNFHKRLMAAKPPTALWPSDLNVPFTDFGDLVLSMTPDVQATIGLDALAHIENKGWKNGGGNKNQSGLDNLRREVEKGKSIVVVDGRGDVRRVVAVVALRLESSEGEIFAQVGKLDKGEVSPSCQLPGGKQERTEMAGDAMKRILSAKVHPFEGCMQVDKFERLVEENESKEYGVRTKYLRTVFSCSIPSHTQLHLKEIPFKRDIEHLSPGNRSGSAVFSLESNGSHGAKKPHTSRSRGMEAGGDRTQALEDALIFARRSVYRVTEPGKPTELLYAWLSDSEFKMLKSHEAVLMKWLEALDPSEAVSEAPSPLEAPASRSKSKPILLDAFAQEDHDLGATPDGNGRHSRDSAGSKCSMNSMRWEFDADAEEDEEEQGRRFTGMTYYTR